MEFIIHKMINYLMGTSGRGLILTLYAEDNDIIQDRLRSAIRSGWCGAMVSLLESRPAISGKMPLP